MPVLPCLRYERKHDLPKPTGYPHEPVTIGEHLKKRRIDLKLLQRDVAKIFSVSEDCITYWERGRSTPRVNYGPQIIEFLGYCPFNFDTTKLSGRLQTYRWRNGLSLKHLGKKLDVHGSTVGAWEEESSIPKEEVRRKLEMILK